MLRVTLPSLPRILTLRFDRSRLATVDALAEFVRTRSSYIAQTSLHGYLKARMGTSFRVWFEDEGFSGLVRAASVKLFVSCAGDLAVFAAATAAQRSSLADGECAALARHCFRNAVAEGLADQPERADLGADLEAFGQRLGHENWLDAAEGRHAFRHSEGDLIRVAPVIDEFKDLDREIVTNSIRFRWRDVREQARRRIDGAALERDWRSREDG